MIAAGRVTVNGETAEIGQKVERSRDKIEVDGIPLPVDPDLIYYLVNKPPGVLSTVKDDRGRRTIVDLVPSGTRVYPVGRLDYESEGLIILTNDGDLTERVTHPRFGVTKTYVVKTSQPIDRTAVKRLVAGVELEDGVARALSAAVVQTSKRSSLVEIVMGEGRKREVRRMFDHVGYPVDRLVRTAIGPIKDRRLKPGAFRQLTTEEVRSLYAAGAE